MEDNPLELVYANEAPSARTAAIQVCSGVSALFHVLTGVQADLAALISMGFTEVAAKKALWIGGGLMQEALIWLVGNQHQVTFNVPWNMEDLQVRTCETRRIRQLNVILNSDIVAGTACGSHVPSGDANAAQIQPGAWHV